MPDAVHSSLSLRHRLLVVISALLCVVVASLIWLGHRQIQRVLLDAASTRLLGVTDNLTALFGQSVTRLAADTRQLGRDSALAKYLRTPGDPGARAAALHVLDADRARALRQTLSITLTSRDGQQSLTSGGAPRRSANDSNAKTPVNVSSPAAADDGMFSPLITTDSGVVFRARTPVVSNSGDTVGYLTSYRNPGTAQGSDAVGKLIGSGASLLLGNAAGNLWTDATHVVAGPPATLVNNRLTQYTSAKGTDLIGVAEPIAGTPWLVWVQEPTDAVLAPARTFLFSMASLAVLVVVGGGIVAWVISRQLTTPLAAVSRAAEDFANGDYGRRVSVQRRDELGSLAASFNTMASQVQSSSTALQVNAEALKLANTELRDSEQRYRQLVELLPDAVVVHRSGDIVLANAAALTLFGASKSSEVVTKSLKRFMPSRDASAGKAVNAHAGSSYVAIPPVVLVPHKQTVRRLSGASVHTEVTNIPFTHDGSAAELMILHDVSERERLEERFRQAQKMEAVGQLAGGVAHDFNNLLSVVTSYSALLLADLPAEHASRNDVQEIANAADRAAALTRQLLAFSRQQVLETRVLDLNEIVHGMEKMLRRIIPSDIVLATKLSSTPGNICADPGQLEQVLMNLAVNARDAMPAGGTLQLETAEISINEFDGPMHSGATPGEYVLLIVSDSGCGMTAAQQERIFDPFFTTKPPGQGTGLGLSTVYGIVKQSGGFIWVYSEIDQGTVFRIYLPRVNAAKDSSLHTPAARIVASGKETVLLVEDEPSVRKTARRILEGGGYKVIEAASGREALEVCARHAGKVDVLLTDMVMPEMSGRELAERFAVQVPLAPIVFMSGYTEDTVLRQSAADPPAFFIQKPFTPGSMMAKLRQALDSQRKSTLT